MLIKELLLGRNIEIQVVSATFTKTVLINAFQDKSEEFFLLFALIGSVSFSTPLSSKKRCSMTNLISMQKIYYYGID